MIKRPLILLVSLLSVLAEPTLAQDTRNLNERVSAAPAGASITLGIRVPLGNGESTSERTTYGLTAAYGFQFENSRPGYSVRTRQIELAQLNFDNAGARDVQLANFSLTQFGRSDVSAQKLNLSAGETVLIVGGVALAVVAVAFLSTSDEDFNWVDD